MATMVQMQGVSWQANSTVDAVHGQRWLVEAVSQKLRGG